MANLILTENNSLLEGTPEADSIAFGIYIVEGVPFTTAGTVLAGAGNDDLFTLNPDALQNGVQLAYGNEGDDNIRLSNLYIAYGGQGNDSITSVGRTAGGVAGVDIAGQQIFAGQGNDTVSAFGGNDYIEGNQGSDAINAGDGLDFVLGGQDDDSILGGEGNDAVYGNRGDDSLIGDEGSDLVHGGQGDDLIDGSNPDNPDTGIDLLALQVEQDTIIGGSGQDTLLGGGNITTTSNTPNGAVDDIFRYEASSTANAGIDNIDFITNFQAWDNPELFQNVRPDKISLGVGEDAVLAGLNFTTGTSYDVNQVIRSTGGSSLSLSGLIADNDVLDGFINAIPPIPSLSVPISTPGGLQNQRDLIVGVDGAGAPIVGATGFAGDPLFNENIINILNTTEITSYTQAIAEIQTVFSAYVGLAPINTALTPVASTNSTLQVYNFRFIGAVSDEFGNTGNPLVDNAGNENAIEAALNDSSRLFMFINNGNSSVDVNTDMFIQGAYVNPAATVASNSDLIFA